MSVREHRAYARGERDGQDGAPSRPTATADASRAAYLAGYAAGAAARRDAEDAALARAHPLSPAERRAGRDRLAALRQTLVTAPGPAPAHTKAAMASPILDPYGRPYDRAALRHEQAAPSLTGVRQTWTHQVVAAGLTPERLASLLIAANAGDHDSYLTLAEEMEERYPQYRLVLGVRKRALTGLTPVVHAASDSAADEADAEAVRSHLLKGSAFRTLAPSALDALGKGFSATEIVWRTDRNPWTHRAYLWRDPRHFRWDRTDGRTLRLLDARDPAEGVPLTPGAFCVHAPQLKAGLPIRSGLARVATVGYLCWAYSVTDWMRFAEVFGLPLRLGRYNATTASRDDIATLIAAVANLGSDAAAALPDTMRVDFITPPSGAGGDKLFLGLAEYWDKMVAKVVLGQVASTEGQPGALGGQEGQQEVRRDILAADAADLAATVQRDVVQPFIDLNYGTRETYPRIEWVVPEPEDLKLLVEALAALVPLGLRVAQDEVRQRLRLATPDADAELLTAPAAPAAPGAPGAGAGAAPGTATAPNRAGAGPGAGAGCGCGALGRAAQRAGAAPATGTDAVDDLVAHHLDDWAPQLDGIVDPVRALAAEAASYEEFLARLPELAGQMDADDLVRRLAAAAFAARGLGDATDAV